MTHKRVRTGAVITLLGSGLLLAGCGSASTAATVGDRKISEDDVMTVVEQIQQMSPEASSFTPAAATGLLVLAPEVIAAAERNGKPVSESAARAQLSGLKDPAPATVEAIRANMAFPAITQEDGMAILESLRKQKVHLNPRYGTFDYTKGELAQPLPNWIEKSAG
ncbi:MAG: SurA N-terminal domain-containing protein [Micrococcales bacterium]|nr:SurA N-terminal domain-containing protein [Micrococcales bacterium]